MVGFPNLQPSQIYSDVCMSIFLACMGPCTISQWSKLDCITTLGEAHENRPIVVHRFLLSKECILSLVGYREIEMPLFVLERFVKIAQVSR